MMQEKFYYHLVTAAILVACIVIQLGAYTRLTNAGLGCPDWPGCYGQLVLPQSQSGLDRAQSHYPQNPIIQKQAWTEMVHRYAAMTLVLMIMGIVITSLIRFKNKETPRFIPFFLIALIIFQAALGMLTVTLKLFPLVVMGHLLGGLLTCASLFVLQLQINPRTKMQLKQGMKAYRKWAVLGLVLLFCQIALGGWVSANYAGLACIGFPTCNGEWIPSLHLQQAFGFLGSLGENYQGGVLDSAARITIQTIHRFGAVITATYLGVLSLIILMRSSMKGLKIIALCIFILVMTQFTLGVINVTYLLPLSVALMHNGVALLLLLATLTLTHLLLNEEEDA